MIQKKNITGILLAGGKSSRMGADKGFLKLNGVFFAEHIIATMTPLVRESIVVTNSKSYDVFQAKRVDDLIPESGPLAGLYSGLYHSETEYNLVLSCDIPLIHATVLTRLIEGIDAEYEVIQIKSGTKTMPLIAIYKKQCMHPVLELLQRGERRMRTAVQQLRTKTILLDPKWDPYVQNINTPDQWNALKNEIKH